MYKAETLDEAYDICYKLVLEGGAIHCITQQQPRPGKEGL